MSSKKLTIIILLLFFVGALAILLAGGLTQSAGDEKVPPPKSALAGALEAALGRFAPSIPLSGIRCNGKSVRGGFTLTEQKPRCKVNLSSGGEKYARAELSIVGNSVPLFMSASFDEDEDPRKKRDKSRCKLSSEGLPALRLEATQEPQGDGDRWECWIQQDSSGAAIVVQKKGSLTLECKGCSASNTIRAQIR